MIPQHGTDVNSRNGSNPRRKPNPLPSKLKRPNPLLVQALAYAAQGWPVFPCQDKKPLPGSRGFYDATTQADQIRRWWVQWPQAQVAIRTGKQSGLVVLDVDPGHGGQASLTALEAEFGPLPETRQARSGGGGQHLYFTWPGEPIRLSVGKLGAGLDIRGDGGYIIAPPSLHHTTGQAYTWENDLPIAPLPEWVLAKLQAPPPRQEGHGAGTTIPEGQRNSTLTSLAGRWRRIGMPPKVLEAGLLVHNAQWCTPPLPEAEVQKIAASVGRYDPAPLQAQLKLTAKGKPQETLGNITLALQHLPQWGPLCWYDAVRDLPMVGPQPLNDDMIAQAALDLEALVEIPMHSTRLVHTALTLLCHQRPRDLLREWLESLPPWDGQPRLYDWLSTYAHAPDDVYSREVSRLLVVSMVVRALDPGCQYRSVVILEGPEDTGKTQLVRALASPEWYREVSHGLEGKEAHMRIKRAWVAELAELSSYGKTDEARLKSYLTLQEDVYIPKYSNFEVRHPRRTVFIGTHNPEGENTYMRGQTGNTRYLPIPVHDINLEGFMQVRILLFAEALHYYREHPTDWWRLSPEGAVAAQEVREERRQRSVYEDKLRTWLERQRLPVVWWELLAERFLNLPEERWVDTRPRMEVTKALKAIGWAKGKRERHPEAGLINPWRPETDGQEATSQAHEIPLYRRAPPPGGRLRRRNGQSH
jgi:Virulence-associated protein E-like domain/Bifunctional DNA primase/polymerase, N-terminal/Primase C terminal 1 (PriCT-1)